MKYQHTTVQKQIWKRAVSTCAAISMAGTLLAAPGFRAAGVEAYDLWIAGELVTNYNADDILGDGAFSYDAFTNTLAVKGDCTSDKTIIECRLETLNIDVQKDAVLTETGHEYGGSEAIEFANGCKVQMTGSGRLTINSDTALGIFMKEDAVLTISNMTAEINTRLSGIQGYDPAGHLSEGESGGETKEQLYIENSNLSVHSESSAICNFYHIALSLCEADMPLVDGAWRVDESFFYDPEKWEAEKAKLPNYREEYGICLESGVIGAADVTITAVPIYCKIGDSVDLGDAAEYLSDEIGFATVQLSGLLALAYDGYSAGYEREQFRLGNTKIYVQSDGAEKPWGLAITRGFGTQQRPYAFTVLYENPLAPIEFSAHPVSVTLPISKTASFSVEAFGRGLTYQWQFYKGTSWHNSGMTGAKTAALTVPVTAARDGQKYRCIVKSANGTSATSSAAVMNIRTGS